MKPLVVTLKSTVLIALLTAGLIQCDSKAKNREKWQQKAVQNLKASISFIVKDSTNVRYENLHFYRQGEATIVCGTLAGSPIAKKNGEFIWGNNVVIFARELDPEIFSGVTKLLCHNQSKPLDISQVLRMKPPKSDSR